MRKLLLILSLISAPTMAPAWLAPNGLVVEPRSDGFHIPYRGLSGARDFWCAAGEYVLRELRLPRDTVIYRTSSPPRRSGQGISFSLSPEGAKKPGLILLSRQRGVSASLAREFCNDLPIELE
ncbi:MAG: hypothetical protein AAGA06_02520 [Pseudomonadota bacterium]